MTNSIEQIFGNLEILTENIYNLLDAFQKATTSNQNITVPIKKKDGTIENVSVNSFQNLQKELSRIDANYKSLINADNLSYTLEADGSISQQTKTSFINAEYLENFTIGDSCVTDMVSNIDDLIFPNVKIPITIDSKLKSDIYCKIFEISEGWSEIGENPSLMDIDYLNQTGKIVYKEVNRSLKLEKNKVKYFGKFTVESLTNVANDYEIVLNDIKYTGINTLGKSIDLKTNDILVSKSGASKYIISDIDKFQKKLTLTRIAGSETLTTGIDKLYFNEIIAEKSNIVNVPVRPAQNIIVFLSTENFINISFPSVGLKIDTTNYQVIFEDKTYTLDEFFSNYVTNFSEFLTSFMNETSIPVNLGITPVKPALNASNFKVVQINKHLNNQKSIAEITLLSKNKDSIDNDINFKQNTINKYQSEIDSQVYKSIEEKTSKLNKIISLRQEINILKTNSNNIAKDIDSKAEVDGLKGVVPKYKVIGFWDVQNPMYSPLTKPQNIIKYEVNYRYLSKNIDTVENTSYNMITNEGKSVSVVFSSWNDLQTQVLNKILDVKGKLIWDVKPTDSVDDININQLAISINEGESIEIKIRSISEAGYPIAPLKSEWSEILRIDFPTDLKNSSIVTTLVQNNLDLTKAEFDSILQNYGLLDHISGTIKDSEKTFLHSAKDIASGQFTPEQKNIALDTLLISILNDIKYLKANDTSNVTIKLVDFNNESFVIKNNSTMELFAGNYGDTISILDSNAWGSIIRKKGYIKITNDNLVPVEIKTLVPGQQTFNETLAPYYYNVPLKNENSLSQTIKQIFYLRNIDITNQTSDNFKLVKNPIGMSLTYPNPDDINENVQTPEKNIVYRDNQLNVRLCKLIPEYATDFVGFTREHPGFNSANLNSLSSEFDRLKFYTEIMKASQYQTANSEVVGFDDNDFYSVGKNTCGAFLYPIINKLSTIQVVGDSTTSTLIIPKESEILIPFVYEYRMIDRLGNINGSKNYDTTETLQYDKKIGFDLLINNETFKFDINVTSKLKSKIKTADSVNINSITSQFSNEDQSILN